jgi:hypothetical protein
MSKVLMTSRPGDGSMRRLAERIGDYPVLSVVVCQAAERGTWAQLLDRNCCSFVNLMSSKGQPKIVMGAILMTHTQLNIVAYKNMLCYYHGLPLDFYIGPGIRSIDTARSIGEYVLPIERKRDSNSLYLLDKEDLTKGDIRLRNLVFYPQGYSNE